jgi:glutamyl-tRNA reductase
LLRRRCKDCEGLLLGVGDMGELVAEAMLAAGLKRLVVAAPRLSRAETLAESLNCHVAPFDDLAPLLADADLVMTAVSGRHTVIAPEQMQLALKKRRRKPVFLVDTGIPGDIDPAVNRVDGAYLYDLTDLERVAMEGRASREQAAREAWAIVDAELASFTKGRAARAAVPAIISLRGRFETMREQVLTECGPDAEKATRLLINRLLHEPTEAMKDMAASRDSGKAEWDAMERLLKRLFKLDETDNHG